jgi:CarD family transcriptional regulator
MTFSVGDKVVHPRYGPGHVVGLERWELRDGERTYYVIEIPDQALTVRLPVITANEVGIRSALAPSSLPLVLSTLRGKPHQLPDDYKERQEQIDEKVKTGKVMELAQVVRDLTWHGERAHLTKRDTDLLRQGQDLLAAEMALVSGDAVSDSNKLILTVMTAAVADAAS